MAPSIDAISKGQRAHGNIGYKGNPIQLEMGIYETCVFMETVKIDKTKFIKLQYITETVPADASGLVGNDVFVCVCVCVCVYVCVCLK